MEILKTVEAMYDYVISYDLVEVEGEDRDYAAVDKVLRGMGAKRKMRSFWMGKREENDVEEVKKELINRLRRASFKFKAGDVFYVVQVHSFRVVRSRPVRKARNS